MPLVRLPTNVPPHKTLLFWLFVGMGAVFALLCHLTARSYQTPASELFSNGTAFATFVAIGWFAVRRVQRDLARGVVSAPNPLVYVKGMTIVIGVVVILGVAILRRHELPQKRFRPIDEKPDYIKKLEEWKP